MTTTSTEISPQQRLTIIKHLAGGKTLDQVALITRLPEPTILDVASHHGYPKTDSLSKAAEILARNIEQGRRDEIPTGTTVPADARPGRPATTSPSSVTAADARTIGHAPDEIRILLNTAKGHPSKRIQAAANRVFDAIDKVRTLIREDEEKHSARRQAEEQRKAARAEIERLEKQLAAAKAKLRGPKPASTTLDVDGSVSASDLRAWAKKKGIAVPAVGRVPAAVREQYDAEQQQAVAS